MSATLTDNALAHDTHRWTAADFFSAGRYWAIFIAFLLMEWAGIGFSSYVQIAMNVRASELELIGSQIISIYQSFFATQTWGWAVGTLLAVATLKRGAWPVLATLIALSAASMAAVFLVLYAPDADGSRVMALMLSFGFHGLTLGALRAAFLIMAVSSLIAGHPRKTDFAFAFCLLLAPAVLGRALGQLASIALAGWLQDIDMPALAGGILAAAFIGMLLVLIPARRLAFDDRPRIRHAPQDRPPAPAPAWIPVTMGLVTLVALTGIVIISGLYQIGYWWRSDLTRHAPFILLLACLLLAGVIYMAFWFYRIHKQVAAQIPSQSLLTPAAATVFVLLAPLGMPIALLMLRDALDEYAANDSASVPSFPSGRSPRTIVTPSLGEGDGGRACHPPISAWFIVWVLFLPPVAMGMIQDRANRIAPPCPGEAERVA